MHAEDLLEECRQRQEDEIVALESIFAAQGDGESLGGDARPAEPRVKLMQMQPQPVIEFYLPVTLPRPTRVAVHTYPPNTDGYSEQQSKTLPAGHLHAKPEVKQPEIVTKQPPSNRAQTRQRNRRGPRERTNRYLNAAASPFKPSTTNTPAPDASDNPHRYLSSSTSSLAEDAAAALAKLSLRPAPRHENCAPTPISATPGGEQSLLHSTKQIPALTHLAPITMQVRLPPTYPTQEPPIIEHLTAPWLPSRSDVQDASFSWILGKLDEQYRELVGMEVLYIWATYLSEGLWVTLLEDQASPQTLPAFVQPPNSASEATATSLRFNEHLPSPDALPKLAAQLIAHSRLCNRTNFDAASFDCAICLETRKGRACTRLTGCGHVFCSECLAGYLSSLVDDGLHRQAKRCPDPECVTLWVEREKQNLVDQEGNLITPSKVKRDSAQAPNGQGDPGGEECNVVGLVTRSELDSILGATRLARLDELTVKAKMEADPSVSYCPRSGCQAPVVRLSSDENSGHWERFRECLSCGFAFCAWCSRSWHGPTSCPVSFQSELIRRYLSLASSSPDRARMEQKFGRKTIESMVRKYEEEQQTQQWLSDYTTPCPTCGIAIEKSYGCNHMTCKSCQTHYCYLCGKPISAQNPYLHFNTPGYECYQRLFDGLLGDQAPQHQHQNANLDQRGGGEAQHGNRQRADQQERPGFALLLDQDGIPIHLHPEDDEIDFLAWQQFG